MAQCCSFRSLFWGLAIFGVIADQVSKYRVFRWLYNDGAGGEFEIVPGVFKLSANFTRDRETGTGLLAGALRTWSGEYMPHWH